MLFTTSSAQDIDKYFRGSYVKFKEFDDRLFLIKDVSGRTVTGVDQDDQEFTLYLSNQHPYEVDYILPNRAVFQYKDKAVMLQRIPARQYKRGLCSDNTQILSLETGERLPVSFAVLKAFVTKQQYFTFAEAIRRKGKAKSFALNSRMSYFYSSNSIHVDAQPIGHYSKESKKLFIHPLFVEDVRSQLKDNNETIEVIAYV